jgi:tRNA threonylcarbamoyladenosine biosynthesis protein TsaE|tara:strand:- start:2794 stop:3261 length:468 start_codon:yes stop_codon:yes gene_type:complete
MSDLKPSSIPLDFISSSEEESLAWAEEFSKLIGPGDCVFLLGNLGAGKTVLSRGISKGLGYQGSVHSPTYSLVHEYENDPLIYHIDLYRLPEGADFEEIGLDYYRFNEGISLIEWPERLGHWSLDWTWTIELNYVDADENQRHIRAVRVSDIPEK